MKQEAISRAASGPDAAGADIRAELARLERLAGWLDARFRIPGVPVRFGLDSIVGLVPGIGDVATLLPAGYLVWRAHRLGVPAAVLARMGGNVALDTVVGSVPVLGDLFDLGFKSNRRNIGLLRQHLERASARLT